MISGRNEDKIIGTIIYADDVSLADAASREKKAYILMHKSPKSESKEGDAYTSPDRNSEGYMTLDEYKREQELQEKRQIKQKNHQSQSQIYPVNNSEAQLLKQKSQTQLKPKIPIIEQ